MSKAFCVTSNAGMFILLLNVPLLYSVSWMVVQRDNTQITGIPGMVWLNAACGENVTYYDDPWKFDAHICLLSEGNHGETITLSNVKNWNEIVMVWSRVIKMQMLTFSSVIDCNLDWLCTRCKSQRYLIWKVSKCQMWGDNEGILIFNTPLENWICVSIGSIKEKQGTGEAFWELYPENVYSFIDM